MEKGYLMMVLHAHLPFVRHPEHEMFLEERWLFEAITECYIPLINVFEGLVRDDVDFRVVFSISPPLISMLTDSILQERYIKYLDKMLELCEKECQRTEGDHIFYPLATMYRDKLTEIRRLFEGAYDRNILAPLKKLHHMGRLELITSCATHGYLPLMHTMEARRAQISAAVEYFYENLGFSPEGIWLPECGYVQGVDGMLKDCGVRYFFTDTHGLLYAEPVPHNGVYAPVCCQSGVATFGRDQESSKQVWERNIGYPGDFFYREFYRDIAYDLDFDYLSPYFPGGKVRVDTGLKYYRITGNGDHKEPYIPELAKKRTAEHADNFIFNRRQQINYLANKMDRKPLVVSPYDAELFGHWWYEGPQWLDYLCRKIHFDQNDIKMITPGNYLERYPENQVVNLPMTSWGEGGYNYVWLNPLNDWIYRHLHRAEIKMRDLADLNPEAHGLRKRVLDQAARELLLAQSSDWAFIIRTGTAVQYAEKRTREHVANFNSLLGQLNGGQIDEDALVVMENSNNIFPNIDYHIFSRHFRGRIINGREYDGSRRYRILLLSWEFPPRTVGGLARHVHDLSVALARLGDEVHVITCPAEGEEPYALVKGVHVHRVPPEILTSGDFMTWVKELNRGMVDLARRVVEQWGAFSLVHAHDWLVGEAAREIKQRCRLPLVTTIHATEYGRNRGIFTPLQKHIHALESDLSHDSSLVICCSQYMAEEVCDLFHLPPDKVRAIANGVEPENLTMPGDECGKLLRREKDPMILFIGRLVPEKGVQILLKAMPQILARVPGAYLVVAGRGPYEETLHVVAKNHGVAHRVNFVGFVDDEGRNKLLHEAAVAVFPSLYEPFGIVVLEAMAGRVPVVVSDTGGMKDIVEHGADGYKVPPEHAQLLAHYVSDLLLHPEIAVEMCHNAWNKVLTEYDWKYIAVETREVYREAMEGVL